MNDPKEDKMKNLKIPLARPWFNEKEVNAAADVVRSGWLIFGKQVELFEKEFAETLGVEYAIAVNSGSSALLVSLIVLGIKEDDEVIVPNMTFISTATAAMFLKAVPVFADIELRTYGMDPSDIEKRITPKTKVIIPIHYAGQAAEMETILEIARRNNLKVLEDSAETHLSGYKGKKCGTIGDIGIFSFTPTKPMTTGEGGMIVTNNEELANKARLVRNFGDMDKFKWETMGFNFRMPEVMGAIGRVQLKKLPKAIEVRRKIALKYNDGFRDQKVIMLPYVRNLTDHNFQLYTIRLNLDLLTITRDEFIQKLAEKGISARLYYPTLHSQGVFRKFGSFKDKDYPNSVSYAKTALSLPIFPELTDDEINYVIESVKTIIENYKK